ncbi:MAG: hypothetical protein J6A79_18075 [Clostridia bacterium]|nr:hypothetical protein [Clostridia bacterium]
MAKKEIKAQPEHKSISEYYDLKTKAVEDLVHADVSNSPAVSEEELRKYRSGPKVQLSDWMKAVLLKWWFAGAVCFFFLWGLGTVVPNRENQLIIVGLALGAVTDLFTNNIFRFYAKTRGENDRWMMFPEDGFSTLPLNILYGFVLLFFVVLTYNAVNAAWIGFTGVQDKIPVGVGPILFGFFTTGWDLLFLAMKRIGKQMIQDAKDRAKRV